MNPIQATLNKAKNKNWVPSLFFVMLALMGLLIYKDYGISWDEPIERLTGIVNLNYIGEFFHIRWLQNDPVLLANSSLHLLQYSDRYFGPAFGIISVFLERLFNINDEQQIYFFRHLLNFAVFIAGVHALYQLATRRFSSWKMGLLAALMLVLSPRLFGESFYNSKDLIFLSVFCIGLNSLVSLILKPTIGRALTHGLITALVIDTRSIGIVLPALTIFYFAYGQYIYRATIKKSLAIILVYGLALAICVTLFWPFLWSNPLGHFVETLGKFSKWGTTQVAVLYLGELYQIQKTPLPWHYVFTWIAVTTPLLYLIFWGISLTLTGWQLIKLKFIILKSENYLQDLLFLSASLGPIIAIVILHSVIYDGWRHLYFIYPAFLLTSLKAIDWIINGQYFSKIIKKCFISAFSLYLASIGYWMIINHPNQNIFFSSLVGKDWNTKFDVDYWGLSTRQALEAIARIDNRPKILIYAGSIMSLNDSLKILAPEIRARFEVTANLDSANYIITNYRNEPTDYSKPPYLNELVYEIRSGDEKIISAYKNPKTYVQQKEYSAGDIILFSQGQPGVLLLGRGWAYPENWGVWINGKSAIIVVPISPYDRPKTIKLNLQPFATSSIKDQKIVIKASGNKAQTLYVGLNKENFATLKVGKKNNIEIYIETEKPIDPSKHGIPNDTRLLSVGVLSAILQ